MQRDTRCGVGAHLRSQQNGPAAVGRLGGPDRPDRRTLGFFFFAGLSLCFFFFGSLSLSSAPLELQPHAARRITDSDPPPLRTRLYLRGRHILPAHGQRKRSTAARASSCSSCGAASPSTPSLSASGRPTHMQLSPALGESRADVPRKGTRR